jgi:SOS-response transcriptional repressor LexA
MAVLPFFHILESIWNILLGLNPRDGEHSKTRIGRAKKRQHDAKAGAGRFGRQPVEHFKDRAGGHQPVGEHARARRAYNADPHWLDTGDGPAPWDPAYLAHTRYLLNEPTGPYRVKHIPPVSPAFNPNTPGTVPVITWEDAAHWGERPASEQSTPERWIPCIAHHSLETYALRVRGNSMTASSGQLKSYPVGSLVFVDTHLKTPEDGERIVARIDETGEVTCKVFKHEDGKRWLLPLNPRHEPIREAFTVLGTVVGKWEDED